MTFSNQIQYAAGKAARVTVQLSRLMANIGGPRQNKRKLLMETSNGILLYGSEIWGESIRRNRINMLLAVQRTYALRIASAYRTVSTAAILVLSGTIPIDLQIGERIKIWRKKQTGSFEQGDREFIRQETIQSWQEKWNEETTARWTRKLLPDINIWVKRVTGEVNYYLTQMISGHGYFRKYLYNIGKCSTPYCLYEDEDIIDDAKHTFFECCKWAEKRTELENFMGEINAESIIDRMVRNEGNWQAVSRYCEYILRRKKPDLDEAD